MLQLQTDDAHRGRVFGAVGTVTSLALLAGTGVTGLTDHVGIVPLLEVSATMFVIAGGLGLVLRASNRAVKLRGRLNRRAPPIGD